MLRKIKISLFVFVFMGLNACLYAQSINMETVFQDIAERLSPSTVSIVADGETEVSSSSPFGGLEDFFMGPFGNPKKEIRKTQATGTGFVIRKDGYILTNAHVVMGASKVTVVFNDGKEYDGQVFTDSRTDLALVKIDANNLSAVEFDDSDAIKVGQWVVAIGNPLGFQNTVTVGVVSGLSREFSVSDGESSATFYPDAIQTDASINPGNSGGPLVDLKGKVIGINSAIASTNGGSIGIGFAVPINTAKFVIERLMKDGKVVRGYLGVAPTNLTPYQAEKLGVSKGAYVKSVTKGTPASDAGIKVEDVITEFNGKKIETAIQLRRAIEASEPGKDVKVKLTRKTKAMELTVKVGELPGGSENAVAKSSVSIGLTVTEINDSIREQLKLDKDVSGVIVKSVEPGGIAENAGIRRGDIIAEIDGEIISTQKDYTDAVEGFKKGSRITVIVQRGDTSLALEMKL